MKKRTLYRILGSLAALGLFVCPILLLSVPQNAAGTTEFMVLLPAFERFRCANCHRDPNPTPESKELNQFGTDFKNNNYLWDPILAEMNSDGDRCSNGFELGDMDGDGKLDKPDITFEQSNPGDPTDCSIALDRSTWGIIKHLFGSEIQLPAPNPFP
jgi:hypothetical protein